MAKVSDHTNYIAFISQPSMNRPALIDLNPDDCITAHLCLNEIDVMEVVILLMIYQVKYMFQIKQKWKPNE